MSVVKIDRNPVLECITANYKADRLCQLITRQEDVRTYACFAFFRGIR